MRRCVACKQELPDGDFKDPAHPMTLLKSCMLCRAKVNKYQRESQTPSRKRGRESYMRWLARQ